MADPRVSRKYPPYRNVIALRRLDQRFQTVPCRALGILLFRKLKKMRREEITYR